MRSLADTSKRSGQRPQPCSVCSGLGCLKHTNLLSSMMKQRNGAVASSRAAPHEPEPADIIRRGQLASCCPGEKWKPSRPWQPGPRISYRISVMANLSQNIPGEAQN